LKRFNITVVFDAILRPDTTGIYVVRALRELGHSVSHYMPCAAQDGRLIFKSYSDFPADGIDFLIYVDDDINYPVWTGPLPKFYWCIDTHRMDQLVGGGSRWDRLKFFDRAFLAQKDRADETGGVWLPLAYDPTVYHPLACEKRYDWSFVGNLTDKRKTFFDVLQRELPSCFVGNAYFAEANRIFNESWLTLNVTFSNDVNMRFFEAQATTALLLSNPVHNGEQTLFSSLEYFDGTGECLEKMRSLLSNKDAIGEKSELQRAQVAGHTYRARLQAMLEHIERGLGVRE
jgi:hypothetical protein